MIRRTTTSFATTSYYFNTSHRAFHRFVVPLDKIRVIKSEQTHTFNGKIPRDKLTFSFARASGPGGQNVNKVNTKVDLRFNVDEADWLPAEVKDKLKRKFATKINKQGELVIQASVHRTQSDNMEDAIDRLREYIREAYEADVTVEHELGRSEKSDKRRLQEKKMQSMKKKMRSGSYSSH